MQTKKKIKLPPLKWCVITGIPVILLLVFYIFSKSRSFANAAVKYFSRPAKDILGTVCSVIPFSVMELMYIAAGVFVIWFIVRTVILTAKADKKLRTAFKCCGILLLVVLYFFTAFQWLLGIDYRSDSFRTKSGMYAPGATAEELYVVAEYFLTNALRCCDNVERDSEGHFDVEMDEVFASSVNVYDSLIEEYSFLNCRSREPKKMYLFSKISSYMGFTGVFFPFTGESNINIDAPACLIPATIAHELAHQRGVYSEQEANFLGITSCVTSGHDVFTYSGYLSGTINLLNALYRTDMDMWRELRNRISGNVLTDWQDNNTYWDKMESKVTKVSETVYDGYLKANGQALGMRSYGACVDLLVAYFYPIAAAQEF